MKTLLDAAKKAYPKREWWISVFDKVCSNNGEFCLSCGDDQMALQIALEDDEWRFWKADGQFQALLEFIDGAGTDCSIHLCGKTKPELLLAIVRQGGGE